jgi:hypothetical protein
LVRRPLFGAVLPDPHDDIMSMEQPVERELQKETEIFGEILPQYFLYITNAT